MAMGRNVRGRAITYPNPPSLPLCLLQIAMIITSNIMIEVMTMLMMIDGNDDDDVDLI